MNNEKAQCNNNYPGVTLVRLPRFKAVSTNYYDAADENKLWAL